MAAGRMVMAKALPLRFKRQKPQTFSSSQWVFCCFLSPSVPSASCSRLLKRRLQDETMCWREVWYLSIFWWWLRHWSALLVPTTLDIFRKTLFSLREALLVISSMFYYRQLIQSCCSCPLHFPSALPAIKICGSDNACMLIAQQCSGMRSQGPRFGGKAGHERPSLNSMGKQIMFKVYSKQVWDAQSS